VTLLVWEKRESGLALVSGAASGCGWKRREEFSVVTVAGFIQRT
jgi:hypothetical protein